MSEIDSSVKTYICKCSEKDYDVYLNYMEPAECIDCNFEVYRDGEHIIVSYDREKRILQAIYRLNDIVIQF